MISDLLGKLLRLRHRERRRIVALLDLICLIAAAVLALWLTQALPRHSLVENAFAIALPVIATTILFQLLRVYRAIIRHLDITVIATILLILFATALAWTALLRFAFGYAVEPANLFAYYLIAASVPIVGYRLALNMAIGAAPRPSTSKGNIGIFGTGTASRQLVASLKLSGKYKPIFFITEDPSLAGGMIDGLRVYDRDTFDWALARFKPRTIIFSCSEEEFRNHRALVRELVERNVSVRLHTGLERDIAAGHDALKTRPVDIEDLIGRTRQPLNKPLLERSVGGKRVLVTGAAGSIGGQLCRRIAALGPVLLDMLDFDEKALVAINREISAGFSPCRMLLGSVLDTRFLKQVFQDGKYDIVFHAAAYKHVDIGEVLPAAVIKNNVLGTHNVVGMAAAQSVPELVMVSTDKAVNPGSVMGATKLWGEELVQVAVAANPQLRYCSVRFGNVIESSGSVVPLFKQQIMRGGPVRITDRRMTRFFMSIDEAVDLILQASAMARGGETFILDMGDPVNIVEIAENLIRLAGRTIRSDGNPDGEIEIVEIGIRQGEKLMEELTRAEEQVVATEHPSISLCRMAPASRTTMSKALARLERVTGHGSNAAVQEALFEGLAQIFQHRSVGGQRSPADLSEAASHAANARG